MNVNSLKNKDIWVEVYEDFKKRNPFNTSKIKSYKRIIETDDYKDIALSLINLSYKFSYPQKVEINKFYSLKKKTVYIFNHQDDFVLKVINRLIIKDYSYLISSKCHSFQKKKGAKSAFRNILKDKNIRQKFVLKTDIKNFFNSIDINHFFEMLPKDIKSNKLIYWVLSEVLLNKTVIFKNILLYENNGLKAGNPLAPFLSNLYLRDIDEYFENESVTYARYSDDLIVFDSYEKINEHKKYIHEKISSKNLLINNEKTHISLPDEEFTFLGFTYKQGVIDISKASILKLKMKIKRLSKRYNRLFVSNKYSENEILEMFINKINKKFFGKNKENNDLCWSMWYFPLINTSNSLKKIDKFIQDRLRYCICGRYSKMNYKKIPYEKLYSLDYKTLTRSYYLFKYDFEKFNKYVQD